MPDDLPLRSRRVRSHPTSTSLVSDVLDQVAGGMAWETVIQEWHGSVTRDGIAEALQLASEEEVRKRHLARAYPDTEELTEEAFNRLYGKPRTELLKTFQKETKKDRRRNLTLSDLNEFTYWLHKLRIKLWDPARVASDTRKAIGRLELLEQQRTGRPRAGEPSGTG